ncbi:hypothetical protein Dimus_012212 [Dionaea muscipula]
MAQKGVDTMLRFCCPIACCPALVQVKVQVQVQGKEEEEEAIHSTSPSSIFHQYLAPMAPPPPALPLRLVFISSFVLSMVVPAITSAAEHLHPKPNALVLPISKHASTLQYTASIGRQRTPDLVPTIVSLDLNGKFLWLSHDSASHNNSSSAQSRSDCSGKAGSSSRRHRSFIPIGNAFSKMISVGNLSEDTISLHSTDGLNPGSVVSTPTPFLFFSVPEMLTRGLADRSRGVAGLGRTALALPTQLSTLFNLSRKFGICLPSSSNTDGVIFFGDGPYDLLPGIDVSKILVHTPLIQHPRHRGGHHEDDYYVPVSSIMVNGRPLPMPLISSGGTKISTTNPYSLLETSVYESLSRIFIEEAVAMNHTRVRAVAPFRTCFSTRASGDLASYRAAMPVIDLVMQSSEVFWRIFETNSMIPVVGEDVWCLGFLDGGRNHEEGAGASIVIGAHLLEDNFLQFDLHLSRLGFTSSLLLSQTTCANFNFTSN